MEFGIKQMTVGGRWSESPGHVFIRLFESDTRSTETNTETQKKTEGET